MKRIVIVGGGFGGLNAAKKLSQLKDVEVIVYDQRNHHLFQPLLYQVATAGLSPADIATPIRTVLKNYSNVQVYLAKVEAVNAAINTLTLDDGAQVHYDYAILACGASHSYFGHSEWESFAPGLKTLEQATEIRRRILLAFEEAERESDVDRQKAWQTFVVVGGGPTGCELAGAITEIARSTLAKDFRNIDPAATRVVLVEAGARILAAFEESLAHQASQDLVQLGVEVKTSTLVTNIDAEGVEFKGERLAAKTVIWSAGVLPSPLGKTIGTATDRGGRVLVGDDLSVAGYKNLFVIGDMAHREQEGIALPGVAQVAIQQGQFVADLIASELRGKPRRTFVYRDKGMMATIGRKRAIVQTKRFRITGFTAWLMWLFVHVYFLIGFKNRLFVIGQWAWSYLTFNRGARLILAKEWRIAASDARRRDGS